MAGVDWDAKNWWRNFGGPLGLTGAFRYKNTDTNNTPIKRTGWWNNLMQWTGLQQGDWATHDLGDWFRRKYGDNDFLKSLTDDELGALLGEYWYGNDDKIFDYENAVKDLNEVMNSRYTNPLPNAPNYQEIYEDANRQVTEENDKLLALLNQDLNRTLDSYDTTYGQGIADLNRSYNDYAKQILSTDYMKNAQMLNAYQSEMSRSRQNALEAGASAGLRLASNINTVMSMQNQQTQQSLDTANNLAQQMLNQRQAAMGLRADYTNAVNNARSQNTNAKVDLQRGSLERAESYANQRFNTEQNIYQNALDNRDTYFNNKFGDNPFGGALQTYITKRQTN